MRFITYAGLGKDGTRLGIFKFSTDWKRLDFRVNDPSISTAIAGDVGKAFKEDSIARPSGVSRNSTRDMRLVCRKHSRLPAEIPL